jgi:hypothetical protein
LIVAAAAEGNPVHALAAAQRPGIDVVELQELLLGAPPAARADEGAALSSL